MTPSRCLRSVIRWGFIRQIHRHLVIDTSRLRGDACLTLRCPCSPQPNCRQVPPIPRRIGGNPFSASTPCWPRRWPRRGTRFGAEAGHDSFRGLYVTDENAAAALRHPPGEPLRMHQDAGPDRALEPTWSDLAADHGGWAWLRRTYRLTDAELDVVLIALAPEIDLRYERVYGYLQDDVSRRRATVNLTLDLISTSPDEKLNQRSLFAADAPLLRSKMPPTGRRGAGAVTAPGECCCPRRADHADPAGRARPRQTAGRLLPAH